MDEVVVVVDVVAAVTAAGRLNVRLGVVVVVASVDDCGVMALVGKENV